MKHLRVLEKEEQDKLQISKQKETINIRAEGLERWFSG